MLGLTERRLDLGRSKLTVVETVGEVGGKVVWNLQPKTEASKRIISLPTALVDELTAHLAEYGTGEGGLVFPSPTGGPWLANNFRARVFRPAVWASVGEPMSPHDLRHTAVALLIKEGVHPRAIQKGLGHESWEVTMNVYGAAVLRRRRSGGGGSRPGCESRSESQARDGRRRRSRRVTVGLAWGRRGATALARRDRWLI